MSATTSARPGDQALAMRGPIARAATFGCVRVEPPATGNPPAPPTGLLAPPDCGRRQSPPSPTLRLRTGAVPPSGEAVLPSGEAVLPSGEAVLPSGEAVLPSGEAVLPSGEAMPRLRLEGTILGARSRARTGLVRRAIVWAPMIVCVLVAVSIGTWVLRGGGVLVMQTPSMGTVAPVGSFVLIHPIGDAPLHQGMIVAFRVPQTGVVYMHRVAAVLPDKSFRTRGDLDAADDGWVLTRSSIVGAPSLILPWLGWVLMGAPWGLGMLVAGLLLAWLLPRSARGAIRSLTFAGCLALPLYKLRPLVRVTIATAGRTGHHLVANLVDSGILPLRVTLRSSVLLLHPGHLGTISARAAGQNQSMSMLQAHAALPLWGWALFAGVLLTPIAIGVLGLPERGRRFGAAAGATVGPAS